MTVSSTVSAAESETTAASASARVYRMSGILVVRPLRAPALVDQHEACLRRLLRILDLAIQRVAREEQHAPPRLVDELRLPAHHASRPRPGERGLDGREAL